MDRPTLDWIAAHRPPGLPPSPRPELRPATRALIRRSAPPAHWAAEPRLADSLHGVRHAMRTAALAGVLAEANGLNAADTALAVVAAAVHDCRRWHDRDDPGHGERAAHWLTARADEVWAHFGLPVPAPPPAVLRAATAVRLHDVPYPDLAPRSEGDGQHPYNTVPYNTVPYENHRAVCDLVKAADALDRYRLPKASWWPDRRRVRQPGFDTFRALAFDLVVGSERARLAGADSAAAVLSVLAEKDIA
ncbi:hypothetical protein FQU76_17940 [Streptomyces qinzhouensis]|uniref:HD domain-containing protein n=2 Tax=Streptomyces qinzhouensis TaxID=2599401 RepID=A0A5B8JH05_9ACTN|nr:hypothetical protein FQU76_17940 [Streptomyces qinzhouensis]